MRLESAHAEVVCQEHAAKLNVVIRNVSEHMLALV